MAQKEGRRRAERGSREGERSEPEWVRKRGSREGERSEPEWVRKPFPGAASRKPATRVAAVILAAGEARRFGGQKLLATLGGRPLLQHVLDAANASSLSPIVLVVGADADEVLARASVGRAWVIVNAAYATGQASSLQAGLRALDDAEAAVVLLGDQPRVTAALLDALAATQRASGAAAVICAQGGRRSPPALLRRELWPAVEALRGDVGAREIIAKRADVVVFEVAASLGALDDVDTREDHERLRLGAGGETPGRS